MSVRSLVKRISRESFDAGLDAVIAPPDPPRRMDPGFRWLPNERQEDLLDACGLLDAFNSGDWRDLKPAKCDWIGYGGARGGGKSVGMLAAMGIACYMIPGIRCLALRRVGKDLTGPQGLVATSQVLFNYVSDPTYNITERTWSFANGSKIFMRACENPKDAEQYKGFSYTIGGFDESTLFTWPQVNMITSSNRDGAWSDYFPEGVRLNPFCIFPTNPDGSGSVWYIPTFITNAPCFVDLETDEFNRPMPKESGVVTNLNPNQKPIDSYFIPSYVWDNTALMESDPTYEKKILSQDERTVQAWYYGRWDQGGMNFFGWRTGSVEGRPGHMCKDLEPGDLPIDRIPGKPRWKLFTSIDYGFGWDARKPAEKRFVAGLYARSPQYTDTDGVIHYGHIYRIDEVALRGAGVIDQMIEVEAMESRWLGPLDTRRKREVRISRRIGCPSMFSKKEVGGITIADYYANAGAQYFPEFPNLCLPVEPIHASVLSRYAMCKNWLRTAPDNLPWFMSCERCTHFNGQIQKAVPDEFKPESLHPNSEDHALEEWGHLLLSIPQPGTIEEEPPGLWGPAWQDAQKANQRRW